jgi:uncharacterized protein (UPF0332 family)
LIKLSFTPQQKRRASTRLALGLSERDAAEHLLASELYREALVHMYFTCFYISQALLTPHVKANPSHKNVETQLHQRLGRTQGFPRTYVKLHSQLHNLRNQFDYHTAHTPSPSLLRKLQRQINAYVALAVRIVPRIGVTDLLQSMYEDHRDVIKDFSSDVYCPRTYSHHNRLTVWQPPFYLDIYTPEDLALHARRMLDSLGVNRSTDYVVGINSRVNQYQPAHFLMLDIDSVNAEVESALKPLGGVLLKSGRGFHFIGRKLYHSQDDWNREMRRLLRSKALKQHLDHDHIEISLLRGYATLRVTGSPAKPQVPFFYKEL